MSYRLRRLFSLILLLVLPGCTAIQGFLAWLGPQSTVREAGLMRESVVERLAPSARNDFDRLLPGQYAKVTSAQESVASVPAQFKRRLVLDTLRRPWEGLVNLEKQGLLLADLADEGAVNLPVILDVLEAGMDRTSTFHKPVPLPAQATPLDVTTFMLESLDAAAQHRDKALTQLEESDKQFLFAHARSIAAHYTPQVSPLNDRTMAQIKADLRFQELVQERIDYANLIASAQVLTRLANPRWLAQLAAAFPKPLAASQVPAGVTGEVLHVEKTSFGLIVIGGPGPNTYELDKQFAIVIDLGGNDLYRGQIAAATDIEHGNSVVIDLEGNDTYNGDALGLATGRLGVGLLIDHAGDDVYQLDMGSGGAGFAGLGILYDGRGNDVYMGNRLTQGAAIGGLGLLFDASGNDRYTSHGFAVGFGGPAGVGAVIDVRGDDHYQCGDKIPSAYNAQDAPNAKAGDPLFQYDCFGLGTGSGARVLTKRAEWQAQSLAGGWGILLDVEGRDHYDSANFSQGHGYFFGAGVMMDLDGNDDYHAARYGLGSSAHHGVSVFIDRRGDDRYGSTGPFYNAGAAWDHGVSVAVDGDNGNDRYDFTDSTGLGAADYSGFGFFIDEGGNDVYHAKLGFGRASEQGLAGFFDFGGKDRYQPRTEPIQSPEQVPADSRIILYPKGGLFVDR